MTNPDELGCKMYVGPGITADELANALAQAMHGVVAGRTVHTSSVEIDVLKNPDTDAARSAQFPDGFLFFPSVVEIYPQCGVAVPEQVELVASILNMLWSRGISAVAACDFEEDLPFGGGFKVPSLPWPSNTQQVPSSNGHSPVSPRESLPEA